MRTAHLASHVRRNVRAKRSLLRSSAVEVESAHVELISHDEGDRFDRVGLGWVGLGGSCRVKKILLKTT